MTLDGLAYDLQAAGDVVAVEHDDLQVQVRLHRSGSITWVDGVAVGTPDTTVSLDGRYRDEPFVRSVDGEAIELGDLGWASIPGGVVHVAGDVTTIVLDDGAGVRMEGLAFEVAVPPAWGGDLRGVLGDGDGDPANDLVRRDGTAIDAADPDAVYGPWLDDWLVADGESLFPTPFDPAWGPTRPDEVVTLATLPPRDVAAAATACADTGLAPGAGLESCTFDVAVTGDEALVTDQPSARTDVVPAAAVDPVVDATAVVAVGDTVGPDEPVAGAGRLDSTTEVDEFELPAVDADRWLVPTAPCAAPLAAVAMVRDGDRVVATLPLWCGQAHPLPTGTVTVRIADPTGTTETYGFTIADRPDVGTAETVEAAVGVPVDLVIAAAGEVPTADLELAAGQRVFVETIAQVPSLLSLTGPTGVEVVQWAPFLDSGVVEVAADGTYVIAAEPVATTTGTVTLLVHDVPPDPVVTAAVGDEVRVDLPVPGQVARVALAPDGSEIDSWPPFLDSDRMTAPTSGTHTITFDPQGAYAGAIGFTIAPG